MKQVAAQLAVATCSVAAHAPNEGGVGAQSGIEYLVAVHSDNTIPLWKAKSDSRGRKKLCREESKDGGAATGHGCVVCATVVHVVLQSGDGGVGGKYGGFEVVDDNFPPLLYRLAHRLPQVGTSAALQVQASVCLAGADMLVGRYLKGYAIG